MAEKCTTITYLISTLLQAKEPEPKEVVRRVSTFRRLRLDTEWTRAKMKVKVAMCWRVHCEQAFCFCFRVR